MAAIPAGSPRFNEYGLLAPGVHEMGLEQMAGFLGFTSIRQQLIENGLKPFLIELKPFAVERLYINGSFVTEKPVPQDIDGIIAVNFGEPLHIFMIENHSRFKTVLSMDFYPAFRDCEGAGSVQSWLDFFGATKDQPPRSKGIIALKL